MPRDEVAEQVIRVCTAFFAALVGFGLKRLLDAPIHDPAWLPFVCAVLVFLRFITGSAVHMWQAHVSNVADQKRSRRMMKADLAFLIAFGVVATIACYAGSPMRFFAFLAVLIALTLLWGALDAWRHDEVDHKSPTRQLATFWWSLDVIHFAVIMLTATIYQWSATGAWWFLLVASAAILWADFGKQITM